MKKKYNIKLLKKNIEREERTDGSFEVNTKQESSKSENEDLMVSCYEKRRSSLIMWMKSGKRKRLAFSAEL
jgi:hypothetical protein